MLERFTDDARTVVVHAQRHARLATDTSAVSICLLALVGVRSAEAGAVLA